VVLVKDVDGAFTADPRVSPEAPLLPEVDAAAASRLKIVDGYFHRAVARFWPSGECWIVNGTVPARVEALLLKGAALGTRVVLSGSSV
jgi:aspartokinase-like uncharacterized kinase